MIEAADEPEETNQPDEFTPSEWHSGLELDSRDSQQLFRSLLSDKLKSDRTESILPSLVPEYFSRAIESGAEDKGSEGSALNHGQRAWKVLIAEAKSFDSNKDGAITISEINALVKDPSVRGSTAMAVASLKLFERSQSTDGGKGGVKIADLERLNNLQAIFKDGEYDRKAIGALLAKYPEGKCDEKELEQLTSFGKHLMERLGGKKNDPNALDKFVRDIPEIIASLKKIDELEIRFDRIDRRSKSIDRFGEKLYGQSNDYAKSIKPEAVCQGLVGNCYFMAGVASLAELQPEQLANMMKQNRDGTFTVTFPGKEPIVVKPPTPCELMLYAGVTEHGIWPAVLDKAFGKYCRDNPEFRKGLERGELEQEGSEGGGTTEGISMLTGRKGHAFLDIAPKNQDKVWAAIADSLKNRRPVIAGTGFGAETLLNGGKNSGLEPRHAYAILKVDEDTITLRNPYGKLSAVGAAGLTETGKVAGTFQLSKEKFWKYFTEVELLK